MRRRTSQPEDFDYAYFTQPMQQHLGFELGPDDMSAIYGSTVDGMKDAGDALMRKAVAVAFQDAVEVNCNKGPLILEPFNVAAVSDPTLSGLIATKEAERLSFIDKAIRRGVEASNLAMLEREVMVSVGDTTPEAIRRGRTLQHRWRTGLPGLEWGQQTVAVTSRLDQPYGDGEYNGIRRIERTVRLERANAKRRRAVHGRSGLGSLDFQYNHELHDREWSVIGLMVSSVVRGLTHATNDQLSQLGYLDETHIAAYYQQDGVGGPAKDTTRANGIALSYRRERTGCDPEVALYTSSTAYDLGRGPRRSEVIRFREGLLEFKQRNPKPIADPRLQPVSA